MGERSVRIDMYCRIVLSNAVYGLLAGLRLLRLSKNDAIGPQNTNPFQIRIERGSLAVYAAGHANSLATPRRLSCCI